MTEKFAKGFSEMNLRHMRRFYPGGRRPRLRAETHFGVQARPLPVGLHLELPIQIQETLSVKSQKFQTPSVKSKTLSYNSSI
jgi:hypothetical protein